MLTSQCPSSIAPAPTSRATPGHRQRRRPLVAGSSSSFASGAREAEGDSTTATGADRLSGPGVVVTDRQTDTDDGRCPRRLGACRSARGRRTGAPLRADARHPVPRHDACTRAELVRVELPPDVAAPKPPPTPSTIASVSGSPVCEATTARLATTLANAAVSRPAGYGTVHRSQVRPGHLLPAGAEVRSRGLGTPTRSAGMAI